MIPVPTKLLVYGGAALLVVASIWGYGRYQYNQGGDDTRAEIKAQQLALAQAQQAEADRNDAEYRGKILAREMAAKDLSSKLADSNRMLANARSKLQTTGACVRLDATGTDDWLGLLGASWAEYSDMAKEAGRLSDKVTGLQGYIKSLKPGTVTSP